jgi:mannose-6-phosphate isomerase-like protein (cupin superfamily)
MTKAKILPPIEEKEYYTEERCHILELFNQPDAMASVARARLEPGVTTALHSLNGLEFYYILSGEGRMEIDGNEIGKVQEGDTVVIPENAPQRITNIGKSDLIFLCFCAPRFIPENYKTLE